MRVESTESGFSEVFLGRDMNFIRFILTKVISIRLSVHNS